MDKQLMNLFNETQKNFENQVLKDMNKKLNKEEPGECEWCNIKAKNLSKHILTTKHKNNILKSTKDITSFN